METIKNLIGVRDQPLAQHADRYEQTNDQQRMMQRGGGGRGGGGLDDEYGGGGGEKERQIIGTPIQTPPRSLHQYGRLEEQTSSHPTLNMSDLQKQIDAPPRGTSSTYSTPIFDNRQMQTISEHEQKYPPITKETAIEGRGINETTTIDHPSTELTNTSNEATLKIESIYTGSMKTAYGVGYAEGYKRAVADLQGHAGKGVIEYPNPSVYKILTEQKEGKKEDVDQSFTLPITNLSSGVGKVGKKTKSFFIRMLEKAGCASTEADRDRESTMETQQNPPTKKYSTKSSASAEREAKTA